MKFLYFALKSIFAIAFISIGFYATNNVVMPAISGSIDKNAECVNCDSSDKQEQINKNSAAEISTKENKDNKPKDDTKDNDIKSQNKIEPSPKEDKIEAYIFALLFANKGVIGQEIELDARMSYAFNKGRKIVKYEWDLNEDNVFEREESQGTIKAKFNTPGDHNITVRVTDSEGRTGETTIKIFLYKDRLSHALETARPAIPYNVYDQPNQIRYVEDGKHPIAFGLYTIKDFNKIHFFTDTPYVKPGQTIKVKGNNFGKNLNLQITWQRTPDLSNLPEKERFMPSMINRDLVLAAPKTDLNGSFSTEIKIPTDIPAGKHQVRVRLPPEEYDLTQLAFTVMVK